MSSPRGRASGPSPTFRPENPLEDALLAARQNDDVERLLSALAVAEVYVPTAKAGPSEETSVRAITGQELPLPVMELDEGSFVPVFTSLRQFALFRPEGGGYVRLPGRALSAVAPSDVGVAINPGGEVGLALTHDQAARIAVAEPTSGPEFLIGEPSEEPVELLDAIRRFAAARQDIRAAYRALLVRRPGTHPELVIGLGLSADADERAAIDAAAGAARAAGVQRLALVPLRTDVEPDQIGRFLLERTKPFWTDAAVSSRER
jgi:hypothetical protein